MLIAANGAGESASSGVGIAVADEGLRAFNGFGITTAGDGVGNGSRGEGTIRTDKVFDELLKLCRIEGGLLATTELE